MSPTWVKADDRYGGARPFKQHSVSYHQTKITTTTTAAAAATTTTTITATNNNNKNDTFRYT